MLNFPFFESHKIRTNIIAVITFVLILSSFSACKRNAQGDDPIGNKTMNEVLITEIENAYRAEEKPTKRPCELDLTAIVQKHIPIGSSKDEILNTLEKNGFEYTVTPEGEGEFIHARKLHKKTLIGRTSFLILVDTSHGKATSVKSKVYCVSL